MHEPRFEVGDLVGFADMELYGRVIEAPKRSMRCRVLWRDGESSWVEGVAAANVLSVIPRRGERLERWLDG